MLTLFVVLVRLALAAAGFHDPRRRDVGRSIQFTKRNNLTNVFRYTDAQLSDLSIGEINRRNMEHTPQMVSVPLEQHTEMLGPWSVNVRVEDAIFKVLVDTGANDLWVFSPERKVPKFAKNIPGRSPEKKPETFDILYLDNKHVEGIVHSSTVSLGSIRVDNQYFGGSTSLPDNFKWEGVLGLPPFPNHNSIHHRNFLHEAIEQHKTFPKFAINPSVPRLDLGWIDHKALTDSIEYHKIVADDFRWTLKDCYITVRRAGQHGTANIVQLHVHRSHIDTGAGLIYGDPRVVKELYQELGGKKTTSSQWSFPSQGARTQHQLGERERMENS